MRDKNKADAVYFAATNSGQGFLNYFPQIFGGDERIYILKGGPGTGKSYFLRQIQKACLEKGLDCESYLCSSDPDSLDGIRIPALSISVFDGTSPHAADAKLPGARENIVNLGCFWDEEKLRQKKEEIEERALKKAQSYQKGLCSLELACHCMRYRAKILNDYLKEENIERAALRFLKRAATAKGKATPLPMHTYGMKGERFLNTLQDTAEQVYVLPHFYAVEYLYLQKVLELARTLDREVIYCPHPIDPAYPEALYFPGSGVLLTVWQYENAKKVGVRRFLDGSVLSEKGELLRYLAKTVSVLTEQALTEFSKMKEHHFALEEIYEAAMDFGAKEEYTNRFLKALFDKEKNDKIF